MNIPFHPWPKTPRLNREIIITEKLDGTNSLVYITEEGEIFAGSRSRWITPQDDNYGFAGWVERNKEKLILLGPGKHFGEWWGNGLQRKYGKKEKTFSLFNAGRWTKETIPDCCDVVPILYQGPFSTEKIQETLENLKTNGSVAAPGFMRPEGIIVFHTAAQMTFKVTCENDEKAKGLG